jgi:Effector-associated domain 10/NACHT domain
MSDNQDINAIFDRIANRNATDGDIQTLRQSVVISGNADGATIVTGDDNILGDNNTVQVGKYNINIAEGSNINVGDTIYQGADAETIRAMLLEVLTDKIAIDSTFSRLFGKSESSGVDWDWGLKLLKQKQLPEIRKRLTDTLGRDRILMNVSIEEQQNWVNRSPLAADRTLQINGEDCGVLDANKMLIETFGRDDIEGKLLILGAPGAGKTTALLSLAEQLVEGAISQPRTVIPVLFELSTWQNDNQSIQDWLIEQLYDLNGGNRKSKLYEQWLERRVLLPLLDGLDELGLERQKKCTEKLDEFAEHYPQLVVCCRAKEFEMVDIKLRNLRGAVCLQSLSDLQIQHYLDNLKRPELWGAIKANPSLQAMLEPTIEGDPGLLRVPLFVKLVADVYDRQQPINGKADLLDKYIDRQLSLDKREIDRRTELDEYEWAYKTVKLEPNWKQTHSHLNWLSYMLQNNNAVELLIEQMQPSWIESDRMKRRYRMIFGLIFGLMAWLIAGLAGWMNLGIAFGLAFGLIFGFLDKQMGRMTSGLIFGQIGGVIGGVIGGHTMGQIAGLDNGLIGGVAGGLICGLTGGLIGDFNKIEAIEAFKLSMSNAVKQEIFRSFKEGMINGCVNGLIGGFIVGLIGNLTGRMTGGLIHNLVYGLIGGLIIGLIGGLIGSSILGLTNGLKQELKIRSRPNQGIWNSLKSQVLITAIIFLLIIFFFVIFSLLKYWTFGLLIAIILGFAVGGGKACLQHLSLRIILWQSGLPWNFARFLNYCVERRLLLRVGGSYRFLHRELLDHFAQSNHLD